MSNNYHQNQHPPPPHDHHPPHHPPALNHHHHQQQQHQMGPYPMQIINQQQQQQQYYQQPQQMNQHQFTAVIHQQQNTFTVPHGIPPQSHHHQQHQQQVNQNYPLPPPQAIISNIKDIPNPISASTTPIKSSPTKSNNKSASQLKTPKKKRGRPPKPNSLAQKITTTLNISINTSPLNSNPAELNSNLMVKRGAPDAFTPLMRVSPSSTHTSTRRRRKSSIGSSTSGSPPIKRSKSSKKLANNTTTANDPPHLVTPLSSSSDGHFPTSEPSYQINYKTLDKLSMVTQSEGYYNTPPPTSTNPSFSTPSSSSNNNNQPPPFPTMDQPKSSSMRSPQLSKINESKQESTSPSRNLLPPVSLTSNNSQLKSSPVKQSSPVESVSKSNDESSNKPTSASADNFLFKLTIDDLGKAVLSGDLFNPTKIPLELVPSHPESPRESVLPKSPSLTRAIPISTGTPLVHTNSVIGIETYNSENKSKAPLRRHNSDITNFTSSTKDSIPSLSSINEAISTNSINNPQTPKETYTYVSTGLTPLFNLTPQFNALMYSVMNINGSPPPFKRGNNPFLVNQEIFTGCGVNESNSHQPSSSSSSQSQQLEELIEQPHLEGHHNNNELSSDLLPTKDPHQYTKDSNTEMVQNNYMLTSSSSDDSGDARLALKKIIHVKRR